LTTPTEVRIREVLDALPKDEGTQFNARVLLAGFHMAALACARSSWDTPKVLGVIEDMRGSLLRSLEALAAPAPAFVQMARGGVS
jgi:hypothetical protein